MIHLQKLTCALPARLRARVEGGRDLRLRAIPLRGGLESCGVLRIDLSWTCAYGERCSDRFVVKRLTGRETRELAVYRALSMSPAHRAVPQLLGSIPVSTAETWMLIEYIPRLNEWPWPSQSANAAVLHRLAEVHAASLPRDSAFRAWDYEADLAGSAARTIELFASAVAASVPLGDRPMLKALERTGVALGAMRTALSAWHVPVPLHGDAHAGNAAVRRERQGHVDAVLFDWGRARIGSPLEDVSSWLQSVGYWDPEVRRRHDSLFRVYLRARRLPDRLTPELRELYWTAAACNAMAGALRYHLAVLLDEARTVEQRREAGRALRDWLRIVRRADASWRN